MIKTEKGKSNAGTNDKEFAPVYTNRNLAKTKYALRKSFSVNYDPKMQ